MGNLAVEAIEVSKFFKLYQEKYTSLKERVIHAGKVPYDEFWALRDVSLEVSEGETVGLLGHNGSGKSTFLKCIAGILQPTKGKIIVTGQVAALLELGAGFHGELSGRDNIYLNASLLGLSRKEVDKRFDAIVAFAELEPFIDNQVKFYSSGMSARLGFAVAVNVEPDVLLVDEVLSVGDERFQRKCMDRIKQFQTEGRTIVLVTHAADSTRQICNRVYVLDHGVLVASGPPGEAIRTFREYLNAGDQAAEDHSGEESSGSGGGAREPNQEGSVDLPRQPASVGDEPKVALPRGDGTGPRTIGTGEVRFSSVEIEHPGTDHQPYILPNEPMRIVAGYESHEPSDGVVFAISIFNEAGDLIFGADTDILGVEVGPVGVQGKVAFDFSAVPLLDGTYGFTLESRSARGGTLYDWRDQGDHFEVMNPGREIGIVALPATILVNPGEPTWMTGIEASG